MAVKDYDRLFIGGKWVAPEGTGTIEVVSPSTEEVVARVPDAHRGRRRQGGGRGPRGVRPGTVAPDGPGGAGRHPGQGGRGDHDRDGRASPRRSPVEMGSPVSWASSAQVLAPTMVFNYYAELAASYAFDEVRAGCSTRRCW